MNRTRSESGRHGESETLRGDGGSHSATRGAGRPTATLQRAVGNQAVQSAASGPDGRALQPKLAISRPSDPAEREAERVADEVTRSDDAGPSGTGIRRSTEGDASGPAASGDVVREIEALRGNGRQLPAETQSFFEERFDRDFSDVRVHTGGRADRLAGAVDARAFTAGTDIVFRAGEYSPTTGRGRHLLAHEMTHIVQQDGASGAAVQRQVTVDESLSSPRFEGQSTLEDVLDGDEKLSMGDEGPAVASLQFALVEAGYSLDYQGASGTFNKDTETAVKMFQDDHERLSMTGEVGRETMELLDRRFPEPDDPTTPGGKALASTQWTRDCVLDVLCEWNEPIIEDLREGYLDLEVFDEAYVKVRKYEDGSWDEEKIYANGYSRANRPVIGVKKDLTCAKATTALYQEWFHQQQPDDLNTRQTEGRAFHAQAEWLLARGLPAHKQQFRQSDGSDRTTVDDSAVYSYVEEKYYGATEGKEGEVVGHKEDTGEAIVEKKDGSTDHRSPESGEMYRYGTVIKGDTDVDTSNWKCTS